MALSTVTSRNYDSGKFAYVGEHAPVGLGETSTDEELGSDNLRRSDVPLVTELERDLTVTLTTAQSTELVRIDVTHLHLRVINGQVIDENAVHLTGSQGSVLDGEF
jgi:hypothetical protein